MGNEKVSVVVPVYNVALWLEECIVSLVKQTYGNFEILLVDDGSTDGSAEICDKWALKDARVRVIHKQNGGAASARNTAIDEARGSLVCFVDSDDAVDEEYIDHLVSVLGDADMAVCSFMFWWRDGYESCTGVTSPGIYERMDYMLQFLKDWSCSLLWNKIFRREAIGDVRMEEGHRVDDEYFTYQVCLNCRRVVVSDRYLYYYRMRSSSAMQDMSAIQEKVMLDRIGYVTVRYQQIAKQLPEAEEAFFRDAIDTMTRYWRHSKDMPQAQKHIRFWAKRQLGRMFALKIPLRQKISYIYALFVKKPAIAAEPNTIQLSSQAYFD